MSDVCQSWFKHYRRANCHIEIRPFRNGLLSVYSMDWTNWLPFAVPNIHFCPSLALQFTSYNFFLHNIPYSCSIFLKNVLRANVLSVGLQVVRFHGSFERRWLGDLGFEIRFSSVLITFDTWTVARDDFMFCLQYIQLHFRAREM